MDLNINHERLLANPDADVIAQELSALEETDFAILARDELTFLQTMVQEGIVLEYQTGSIDEHFSAEPPPTEMQSVIAAFQSYAAGTEDWQSAFSWELMEMTPVELTVLISVSDGEIDGLDDPFDHEAHIELPAISVENLTALHAILVSQSVEKVGKQFPVLREIHPAGTDGIRFVGLPTRFVKALGDLQQERIAKLAAQWHSTRGFPRDDYDVDEVSEIINDLIAMSEEAVELEKSLVACAFL